MKESSQKDKLDSLEFLEEITDKSSQKIDIAQLKLAGEHHISLEELEKISEGDIDLDKFQQVSNQDDPTITKKEEKTIPQQSVEEQKQDREVFSVGLETHLNLQRIELPLREVIRKVFWRTSRPIVIISDDKIIYANPSFLDLVGKEADYEVLGKNFFEFVSPEYWDKVSEGIGDVLTKNQAIQIGIKSKNGKIIRLNFEGIYISDEHTFSFILLGVMSEKRVYAAGLFNERSGLPSYNLLRDRIKMSISARSLDTVEANRGISALASVYLETTDFMDDFRSMAILKRIFERLLSSLDKHYTLAHGEEEKEFFIYIPKMENMEKLTAKMQYIKDLFERPVEENYSTTRFICTMGVSTYPEPATSAKKLVEEAKLAQKRARQKADGKIVYFGE